MTAIKHTFHISAPQEKVFDAISTIEHLKNWWTTDTSGGDNLGEVIRFRFGQNGFIHFKVDTINKPDFYKWVCDDAHPEWLGTEATFQLSQHEGKTQVKFVHSGWAEQSEFYAACCFSWARYFISLRDYLEKGKGDPYRD